MVLRYLDGRVGNLWRQSWNISQNCCYATISSIFKVNYVIASSHGYEIGCSVDIKTEGLWPSLSYHGFGMYYFLTFCPLATPPTPSHPLHSESPPQKKSHFATSNLKNLEHVLFITHFDYIYYQHQFFKCQSDGSVYKLNKWKKFGLDSHIANFVQLKQLLAW